MSFPCFYVGGTLIRTVGGRPTETHNEHQMKRILGICWYRVAKNDDTQK